VKLLRWLPAASVEAIGFASFAIFTFGEKKRHAPSLCEVRRNRAGRHLHTQHMPWYVLVRLPATPPNPPVQVFRPPANKPVDDFRPPAQPPLLVRTHLQIPREGHATQPADRAAGLAGGHAGRLDPAASRRPVPTARPGQLGWEYLGGPSHQLANQQDLTPRWAWH